ncbi:MAG: ATP-binding protein [Pseudonocardiaceae bacterium]
MTAPAAGEPRSGYEIVEPRAEALVESLRAFGYATETAVADLIDNSISAGATAIDVHVRWAGDQSWVAISDDGRGMNVDQLREAMRAGSGNPLSQRDPRDLGRFGLGLKTASFSQCRRLVVMSSTGSTSPTCRTWDLDHIALLHSWQLLTTRESEDQELWDRLHGAGQGTVVLWRALDRLIASPSVTDERAERHFYSVADRVAAHLGIIFHRFVTGPGRITIKVNGRSVKPWDPFLELAETTQVVADESLLYRGVRIGVKAFVLPHVSRMTTHEYESAAGPRGWASQQGFYVYRNRRLIVSGSWLGLGYGRDEPTKLARICLDLPNTMDQDWQVDVRKSVARTPGVLVPDLKRIAGVVRERSRRVYQHRGKVLERAGSGQLVHAWEQLVRGAKIVYRVNRSHPLVEALLRTAGRDAEALVQLLEETIPVPLIILDHADGQGRQAAPFEGLDPEAVRSVLTDITSALARAGMSPEHIVSRLWMMEPFSDYPDLVRDVCRHEFGQGMA